MLGKLFLSKKVNIVDGDNRKNNCAPDLRRRLINMLNNGMCLKGIQIFHYASVHYVTRWNLYPLRFLNALVEALSSIQDSGIHFSLNNNEDSELQGDSSEVLGIGLSNMFMCRWYGLNINRVEKIMGSGKRCDYRFAYENKIIVFESKGRSYLNQLKSARKDCLLKKANYAGNTKYSTICHLARNCSPVTLHLFDPPINDDNINYNEYYVVAKHYKNITEMAGLTILSSAIHERIHLFEETGNWDDTPLRVSNVVKMGVSITYGSYTFWTRESQTTETIKNNDSKLFIRFGIEKQVIRLLEQWDMEQLFLSI